MMNRRLKNPKNPNQIQLRARSARLVLAGALAISGSAFTAFADTSPATDLYSVDVRDVARFHGDTFPESQAILNSMIRSPMQFFPAGVTLAPEGVGKPVSHFDPECALASRPKRALRNSVYGVELQGPPTYNADGSADVGVTALIHSAAQSYFFRQYQLRLSGSPLSVEQVKVTRDVPSTQAHFSLEASLLKRRAILTDAELGITKVYPLGVGGFDEGITHGSHGQTRLVTPLFVGASIDKGTAIDARDDHKYYCGMPFLRITRQDGEETPIGLHIIQHREMVRGFDSHGCMRLREKDLYEVHALLKNQGSPRIGVNVSLTDSATAEHPYPLREDGYMGIKDCANPAVLPRTCTGGDAPPARRHPPQSCQDEHKLTQMHNFHCQPPIADLVGIDGDHMDPASMDSSDGATPGQGQGQIEDSMLEELGDERP